MGRYPGTGRRDGATDARPQADVIDLEAHRQRRKLAAQNRSAREADNGNSTEPPDTDASREGNHHE